MRLTRHHVTAFRTAAVTAAAAIGFPPHITIVHRRTSRRSPAMIEASGVTVQSGHESGRALGRPGGEHGGAWTPSDGYLVVRMRVAVNCGYPQQAAASQRRDGNCAHRASGRCARLLEAALAEFDEHGFQAVRVDDIVRRAQISHGTFYLYFASKEDLFKVLVQGALHDMALVADEFPVVTRNAAGRAALQSWVHLFCRTYEAHATVLWIITRTQVDDPDIYRPGLQLFFRLSEIMAERMTAAAERGDAAAGPAEGRKTEEDIRGHAELTGLLCLLMLEGVSTLLNAEVQLPRDGMADRISDIIYAAFAIP